MFDKFCSRIISVAVIKHPNKSNLGGGDFTLAPNSSLEPITAGKSGSRDLNSYIQHSYHQRQREMSTFMLISAELTFFPRTQSRTHTQGMVPPTVDWCFPHRLT